jgi:hypothetical protein
VSRSCPGALARAGALALLAGACVPALACARPAPFFSVDNARAHVSRLAGDIGPRPVGSDANRRAREYVVDQLRFFGYTVRVQDAEAARPDRGVTARVHNVIAVHPGAAPDAIALVAHYDSDAGAPGAADDGLGVAVCLEAARQLGARRDRRLSSMVLLTDAEENGLLGAAALVNDPEVLARVRAYINVEATGSAGPAPLFEAGPDHDWILRSWAAAAPAPRGGSFTYEIYRHLPNDTDFTILKRMGAPGLNFAAIGDSYAYHTALDTPERLSDDVIGRMGANVLATALALDGAEPAPGRVGRPVYFDVAGRRAVVWSASAARVIAWLCLACGVLAVARVLLSARAALGWRGIVLSWLWAVMGFVLAWADMVVVVWMLRAVREVYHPWYAHPIRLWILLVLCVVLVVHALFAIGSRLTPRWRAPRHPMAVWLVALPIWVAMGIAAQLLVPAAAYFWTLPVAVASVLLLVVPRATGAAGRLATLCIFVVVATLWLPDAWALLQFSVALGGRLPVVVPVEAYPAVVALGSVMVAPPILAFVAAGAAPVRETWPRWRRRVRLLLTPGLTMAVVAAFGWSYFAEAYTATRPVRRLIQYAADYGTGRALWEIAGNEPGLDILVGRRVPSQWHAARGPLLPGVTGYGDRWPFALRTTGELAEPPVDVEGRSVPGADGVDVALAITPHDAGATAIVMLPAGAVPVRSSLPGIVRNGRWTAAYVAAPVPLEVTFTLPASEAGRLDGIRGGIVAPALPGGSGPSGLPPWLSRQRTAWHARGVYLRPVRWVAPADGLR